MHNCAAARSWLGCKGLNVHGQKDPVCPVRKCVRVLTFALCSSLNDTRQIQQLDFCIIVMDDSRYTGQGGELIGCHLRRCASELRQNCTFAYTGKACKHTLSTVIT